MITITLSENEAKCLAYSLEYGQIEGAKKGIYLNTGVCLSVARGINEATGRQPDPDLNEISAIVFSYWQTQSSVKITKE